MGLLDAKSWKGVVATKVQEGQNILGLDADALVVAYKHLLRSSACRGKRVLALVDNMPLCLAVAKGRASSAYLLPLLKICMMSLATGTRLHCRWIPSERNPADALSRGRRTWFSDSDARAAPPLAHGGEAPPGCWSPGSPSPTCEEAAASCLGGPGQASSAGRPPDGRAAAARAAQRPGDAC
eukprot:777935-Pyramimonas_sp.AAC.1